SFSMTQWIADIKYMHASAAIAPSDGAYGVFGFSVASVDYGTFNRTIRDGSGEAGYIDLGEYSPKAMALGLGYAKALSDKFSIGGNLKYVYQDLGSGHIVGLGETSGSYVEKSFDVNVFAFDFGILYKTGFKSLNFGMSLRNFSQEIEYVEESFQLPLTFKLGLSMDLFDLFEMDKEVHSFLFAIDAEHPRDYKEQLHIGGEYTFYNALSLRLGYILPTDEQGINAGVGVKHSLAGFNFGVDYAYLDFGIFENVHRFSINISY
ncbi:MAG: PorV/PorQ family protein, partial [Melioribacteraceae bacterium]|nr:PorV/PorQ family protein [Melioribacteraceae bacterium]